MKRIIIYPKWLTRSLAVIVTSFIALNIIFPPPLAAVRHNSAVVTDHEGRWLAGFTVDDGIWRIPAKIEEIDPRFVKALIAVEDKRFYNHSGVDVPAIGRALLSWRQAGKPVSGASTLTMQLVRQYKPRERVLSSKIIESFRALQLELFMSKDEIIESYLTRVSYGGNLEGVTAASLAYFGKPPHYLTDAEIALLIALPQAPDSRRPDLKPEMATKGRDYILEKLVERNALDLRRASEAKDVAVSSKRHDIPEMAWITAYGLSEADRTIRTTLDRHIQEKTESLTRSFVEPLNQHVNTAITIVDNRTMKVRAHIASADRARPGGWIDMTDRARSPGSTLKPFIYALAIDDGVASAGSFVHDAPTRFGSYQPENFNRRYYGDVRIYEALRHSLNVPAVAMLDHVGGQRLEMALEDAGADITHLGGGGEGAGLALALGGAGLSVNDLAVLYSALANGGTAKPLIWMDEKAAPHLKKQNYQLISENAANEITQILRQAPTPSGRVPSWLAENAPPIAYKTGTSYGFRDAWAAGYTDDWTVVVWVGRPDGAPRTGETGRLAAAPLLFDIFAQLPFKGHNQPYLKDEKAPGGLMRVADAASQGPQILFPPDGAEILATTFGDDARGFSLSARAEQGQPSFYIDGQPLRRRDGKAIWYPSASGFYAVSAVDASGRQTTSHVRVLTPDQLANATF
ncbi:MAG: penicillin-binding protein 1C [Hellea sp.]